MTKYYYNGVLLPEIPAVEGYGYVAIRYDEANSRIDCIFSQETFYYTGSTIRNTAGSSYRRYIASISNPVEWAESSDTSYQGWTIATNRRLLWSNHDIPNGSATSATVYFPATYPMPESTTGKCKYNGEEAPSIPVDVLAEYPYIYMTTAKAFAAFSVRPYFYSTSSYPSTLKADGPGVIYKLVDGKWMLNESLSSIYIIISSILWANYNVPNGSEKTTNVYFTGSSPVAINYLFGYLIRSGSTLYTVADGALSALAETEITASLFQTYGVDDLPDGALLMNLTDPELLYWQDSEEDLPILKVKIKGTPPLPQIMITQPYNIPTSGIKYVEINATEDILFSISFDGEESWLYYVADGKDWLQTNDNVTGMTASEMMAIPQDMWYNVSGTATQYQIRFILPETTSKVTSIVIYYLDS